MSGKDSSGTKKQTSLFSFFKASGPPAQPSNNPGHATPRVIDDGDDACRKQASCNANMTDHGTPPESSPLWEGSAKEVRGDTGKRSAPKMSRERESPESDLSAEMMSDDTSAEISPVGKKVKKDTSNFSLKNWPLASPREDERRPFGKPSLFSPPRIRIFVERVVKGGGPLCDGAHV